MRLLKWLGITATALVVATLAVFGWLAMSRVSSGDLPPLKDGDIVFQSIQSPQTAAIAIATFSPYTHVGIIKMVDGEPYVVEAVGPVREIPLDQWIEQGIEGRIAVKSLHNLTEQQAADVLQAAREYYGRPYDFYFLFDKAKIYCSELVYYAFQDALRLTLGKVEELKDLSMDNFIVRALVEERWKEYPPCRGVKDFEKCFSIVLKQKLVSPASIAADPRLETVFSNYAF